MRSNTTAFADEADLISATAPNPGADPDYWLDAYPILTEALTAADQTGLVPSREDAAVLLADIADSPKPVSDTAALSTYIAGFITVPK